ncbi:MAG TPA: fused MFS/spermidine synthase, partial [Polyangiales bacterium]|nr:fused MFS/spermidine synthase [Polyangiales bacterium]
MSGLVYEVVWVRAVGLHLGTSTPAISLVTATFMAGLAAGNAWLGRRADHTSRPLELYARVELGIGIAGATVSLLLLRAGSLLDGVSRFAETLGPAAFAARALVLVSLLIVPTTLMGGTLPVVSRVIVRHGETGAAIGGIYAWNTFGAVAGVLLPDFWLIPLHGMTSAVWVAALGNAVVAASALWMARRNDEAASSVSATAATSTGPSTSTSTAVGPLPWLLTATSGFCGMALEVLFARTLSHWTSALVTSFAVLIAVYLITLAVGASLTRRAADRVPNPAARAAQLLALTGLAVLVELVFAPHWRTFERELWPRELRRPGLWFEACDALLHATYLEALPCLTMGAAFPFVARAFVREGAVGSSTGRLFTINTLAGTLGSLVAGFVWLAWLGAQRSYFAASALLLLPLMICSAQDGARSRLVAAGAGALAWLGLILTLPANHLRLTHFRGGGRITAVREGATTIAAAEQRYTFGSPSHMLLLTPGVSMSDTSFGARRYMAMMAHAAMLSAREPKRALLICYGVGNTARSLLSHEELQSLDVVDISPEVLSLAGEFAGAHGGKVPL